MAAGVLLLAGFAGFKFWSAQQSNAGLDAFEAAREAHSAAAHQPVTSTFIRESSSDSVKDEQALATQFT
ncbi:MAG: hypothetical protein AAGH19_07505, partial [Pseudomonadota bacterium]